MKRRWIVTALGKDRPGIVAGVTEILYRLGCNLEDSAMTRLGGEFAMMLIFSSPAGAGAWPETLRDAFQPLERRLRLLIHLKPLTAVEARVPRRRGRRYLISVYGADRPEIVFHISALLARHQINIADVHTHRSRSRRGRSEPSLYLLLLEIELPPGRSPASLQRQLHRAAKRLGVEASLKPVEAEIL